jgi:hypothetical protein
MHDIVGWYHRLSVSKVILVPVRERERERENYR